MTEAEVREVLARLSEERTSPQVKDVAAIAGVAEEDVRRVLAQVRAEHTPPAESMSRILETDPRRRYLLAASVAMVFLAGIIAVLMAGSSTRTESAVQPPPPMETATTIAEASTDVVTSGTAR